MAIKKHGWLDHYLLLSTGILLASCRSDLFIKSKESFHHFRIKLGSCTPFYFCECFLIAAGFFISAVPGYDGISNNYGQDTAFNWNAITF